MTLGKVITQSHSEKPLGKDFRQTSSKSVLQKEFLSPNYLQKAKYKQVGFKENKFQFSTRLSFFQRRNQKKTQKTNRKIKQKHKNKSKTTKEKESKKKKQGNFNMSINTGKSKDKTHQKILESKENETERK